MQTFEIDKSSTIQNQDSIQGETLSPNLVPDTTGHARSENGTAEPALPDNVTEEPQHAEHMHLGNIRHDTALVGVYLRVSDDEGELLGDTDLENKVKGFIDTYKGKQPEEIENLVTVLAELKSLYEKYAPLITRTDAVSEGTLTKYRIRMGMLLNIEKDLFKAPGKNWVAYFAEKYGKKRLRSAQDYMALAKVSNIIRYAVYGKERLRELIRAIKELDIQDDDPIAAFLDLHRINYTPDDLESDEALAEMRIEIDTAIFMTKLKKVEDKSGLQFSVSPDLVKRVIKEGKTADKALISRLKIIKESGQDAAEYLDKVCINGGHESTLVKAAKGVENLPRLVVGLGNLVGYLQTHTQALERISPSMVETLEQHVAELKRLINNRQ